MHIFALIGLELAIRYIPEAVGFGLIVKQHSVSELIEVDIKVFIWFFMYPLFGIHPVLFCHEMQGIVEWTQDEVLVDNVATVEADQFPLGDWTDGEQALTLNI